MINFAFLQFNTKFTDFEFSKPMKTEVFIKKKYCDKAYQFSVLKGISCRRYFKNF